VRVPGELPGCSAAPEAHPLLTEAAGLGRVKLSETQVGGEPALAWRWSSQPFLGSVLSWALRFPGFLHQRQGELRAAHHERLPALAFAFLPSGAIHCVLQAERSEEETSAMKSLVLGVMPLEEEVTLSTITLLRRNQTLALTEIKLNRDLGAVDLILQQVRSLPGKHISI